MQRRSLQEDEHLERLWEMREDGRADVATLKESLGHSFDPQVLRSLAEQGLIRLEDASRRVELTDRGEPLARRVIRAHRLGERLIHVAFGGDFEAGACEFEHTVTDELVDAICTLLGHPRECPHGLPIPEGGCCRRAEKVVESPAVPLTELEVGQSGRVVYVGCRDDSLMHKIDGLHIRPGAMIRVHQRSPSFVIECEGTNIALDEGVAESICVWQARKPDPLRKPPGRGRRPGWVGRLLRGA